MKVITAFLPTRAEDSFTYRVGALNCSTKIEFGPPLNGPLQRRGPNTQEPEPVHIHTLENRGILLEIQQTPCIVGHVFRLWIQTLQMPVKIEFKGLGKVKKTTPLPSGRILVDLTFVELDDASWQTFKAAFSKRQDEINLILANLKGA